MAIAKKAYKFVLVSPAIGYGLIKGAQKKEAIVWKQS